VLVCVVSFHSNLLSQALLFRNWCNSPYPYLCRTLFSLFPCSNQCSIYLYYFLLTR
jgi:hypothetical protein